MSKCLDINSGMTCTQEQTFQLCLCMLFSLFSLWLFYQHVNLINNFLNVLVGKCCMEPILCCLKKIGFSKFFWGKNIPRMKMNYKCQAMRLM